MNQTIEWTLTAFNAMSVQALYDVMQLRSEVFVVEQHCVFQEVDGADPLAMHLLGRLNGQLVAYARCFPAGVKFSEASMGRVVTRRQSRGSGLGDLLIRQTLSSVSSLWGTQAIRIGAQAHLSRFYSRHGFVDVGVSYIEDGINHLEMLWLPNAQV